MHQVCVNYNEVTAPREIGLVRKMTYLRPLFNTTKSIFLTLSHIKHLALSPNTAFIKKKKKEARKIKMQAKRANPDFQLSFLSTTTRFQNFGTAKSFHYNFKVKHQFCIQIINSQCTFHPLAAYAIVNHCKRSYNFQERAQTQENRLK